MRCAHRCVKTCINLLVSLLVLSVVDECASTTSPALETFFSELDNNRDGTIDVDEASQFIGGAFGQEFDEPDEAATAAVSFLHSIDGGDAGLTVSVDELDVHLHAVLNGVKVHEWIRHGVGLPQYAEAFRMHSIVPCDFPLLVKDNGKVLEEELGVSSPFHRVKLVRAIRRQILGLGQPPSEPQAVTCITAAPTYGAAPAAGGGGAGGGGGSWARVHWSAPANPGSPPLHRYVLERAGADGQWRQVAELDDPEPAAVVVTLEGTTQTHTQAAAQGHTQGVGTGTAGPMPLQEVLIPGGDAGRALGADAAGGQVLFRVAAWNLYGRSTYGMAACRLEPPLPPGYPILETGQDAPNLTSTDQEAVAVAPPGDTRTPPSRGGAGPATRGWAWAYDMLSPGGTGSVSGPGAAVCPGGSAAAAALDTAGDVGFEGACPGPGWAPALAPQEDVAPDLGQKLMLQRGSEDLGGGGAGRWRSGGVGDGSALGASASSSRTVWSASGGSKSPGAQGRAVQGGVGVQVREAPGAEAPPRRWWRTLLLMALPWLPRLLPLPVLQALVAAVQRLLLRAHAAVGRQPPAWLLPPPTQPREPQGGGAVLTGPLLQPSAGTVLPLPTLHPYEMSVGGLKGGAMNLGGGLRGVGGAGGGAGGSGQVGYMLGGGPDTGTPIAQGTTAAAAQVSAAGIGPRRSRGLEGTTSLELLATHTAPAYAAAASGETLQRAGLLAQRPPLPPAAAPSPYGSPGNDLSVHGVQYGAAAGQRTWSGPPPHRSPSEGDLGEMEDTERTAAGQSAFLHGQHPPSSPMLVPLRNHPLFTSHQVTGSAPSLALGSLMMAGPGWAAGGHGGQLAGGPGGRGAGGLREAETELDLVAVGSGAAAGGGGGGVSGRGRGKMCAIPGCGRKLDLRHYREFLRRHYCGRCQRTVCGQHTAYSPHGPTGSCDHVSRCVCTQCFTHFNPDYQLFLLKHNKLQTANGVNQQALSGAGGSPQPQGQGQGQPEARGGRSGSWGGSRRGSASGGGSVGSGSGPGSASGGGEQENKSAAKLLWERAATKLKAVTRFRKKGREGHDPTSQALEGIVE